jgi:hypothetical protein
MKTVAVVGASSDRRKFGNKAFRAFQQEGHTVIPINPNEPSVEGVATYPSVTDVPGRSTWRPSTCRRTSAITLLEGSREEDRRDLDQPGRGKRRPESPKRARRKLNVIEACSIVGIGRNPYSL